MDNAINISNICSEINILKEKITILEKDNYNMNQIISKELTKNKNLENNSLLTEFNILKKRQDQFESALINDFSQFKSNIINDINDSHSNLLQNFDNIISQYNNYNYNNEKNDNYNNQEIEGEDNNNEDDIKKKDNNNKQNQNNIGDELFKENINYNNHNYSIDSIKSNYLMNKEKLSPRPKKKPLDEVINKEFSQYRSELNKNILKLSLLEKKYNGLSTQYYTDSKNINNNLKSLNDYQKNCEELHNNINSNFKSIKDDFAHNVENNKMFISEISQIIENFQKKINVFENNFNEVNEQYKLTKNGIDEKLKNIAQTLNNELNEFYKSINNQILEQNKEIDKFEKFISQENEKFIKFIQNYMDESNSSIKKLFDFNGDDIKKLNDKIEIIQEIIKKVRNDVFKSINDSEEFLENKYQSLFRLINKE